jgi:hypothetical protein
MSLAHGAPFRYGPCESSRQRNNKMKIQNLVTGLAIVSTAFCMTAVQSAYSATNNMTNNTTNNTTTSSIQSVINNPNDYLKKTVTLDGKVDRVIDSGSFVIRSNTDPSQRILVMTAVPTQNGVNTNTNQKAGVASGNTAPTLPTLKDKQNVQVTGKFDVLVAKAETDSYNPNQNSASFSEMTTNTPVLVVQPNQIHLTENRARS